MLKYKLIRRRSLRRSEKIINNYVKNGWKLEKMVMPIANEGYIMIFSNSVEAKKVVVEKAAKPAKSQSKPVQAEQAPEATVENTEATVTEL